MGQNESKRRDNKKSDDTIKKELLKVHKKRIRKVFGCMKCFREILPDAGDKIDGWGYVCGSCHEEYWFCVDCVSELIEDAKKKLSKEEEFCVTHDKNVMKIQKKKVEKHRLFKEPIDLQMNVERVIKICNKNSEYSGAFALRKCFQLYENRWLLGERDEEKNEFVWRTYASVYKEARTVFIACCDLFDISKVGKKDDDGDISNFCMVVGAASQIWYTAFFAMALNGIPLVPMPENSSIEHIKHVAAKVKPRIIFISKHMGYIFDDLKDAIKLGVVVFEDSEKKYEHLRRKGTVVDVKDKKYPISYKELLEHGKRVCEKELDENIFKLKKTKKTDVKLLTSSSGTTGMSKLIIVSDGNIKFSCTPPKDGFLTVVLSLKPLRQCFDLVAKGGRIGIFTSISKLFSDLRLVRPTIFGSTPAFFLRLFEEFKLDLRDRISAKPEVLQEKVKSDLIKEWIDRNVLGNRCRFVLVGGAKSSKELKDFIFDSLNAVVMDAYGTSETGAVSSGGKVFEGVKMQLLDSLEYGYMTTDEPNPRGEIIVHTFGMTLGYYKDEEATKKQFVNMNGVQFSRTGDIGELVNGRIVIIDRIKSLFKLSNGLFVAPSPIECLYENSPLVQRVFIWGNSEMACVTAAVVIGKRKQEEKSSELKKIIKKDFALIARNNGLSPSHVPSGIVIDENPWTFESGLCTNIGKPIRSALIKKYRKDLLLVSDLRSKESPTSEVVDVKQKVGRSTSDLIAGFVKLIRDCIVNLDSVNLTSKTNLFELGANSLQMASIVGRMRRKFSSKLTLPELLQCETLGEAQNAMFGITGGNCKENASWWENETKLALRELKEICEENEELEIDSNRKLTVLLTGARGFLGSFILSELLKIGGRVLCVVRSKESIKRENLRDSVSEVLENFELKQYKDKWDVVEGDIVLKGFGMDEKEMTEKFLKIRGDKYPNVVIHCAAVVGSAPYSAIRPCNVLGTVHAIALAKRYGSHYLHISTIGFLPFGVSDYCKEDIRCQLSSLGGYAQSKWVAEQVVLRTDVITKSFVRVVRVGTCFGSRGKGIANINDRVVRMISGLVLEGIFCKDDDSALPSRFRLVPVDWVAENIVCHLSTWLKKKENKKRVTCAISLRETTLREIVDALKSCGIHLKCVSSIKFREKMEEISTKEKKYHPLFVDAITLACPVDIPKTFKKKVKVKVPKKEVYSQAPDLIETIKWMTNQGLFKK